MKILEIVKKPEFYAFISCIVISFILYFVIKTIINKMKVQNKRQNTIKNLLLQIIKVVIITLATLICLSIIGINVTSFLAGLGIASVVVGLALQDIMKDILSGMFIIFEGQYDVGDVVEINGYTGEVVKLGLKSTHLKNYEGKVKIISNRNISEVINCSKINQVAVLDIPVSYESDLKVVEKTLDKIAKRIDKEVENTKKETKVLGIDNFDSSAIVYRIMVEVKSGEQATAKRTMRKIVKEELDKNNIEIPYNKIEVINGK